MTLPVKIKLMNGLDGNEPPVLVAFITGANIISEGSPLLILMIHFDRDKTSEGESAVS